MTIGISCFTSKSTSVIVTLLVIVEVLLQFELICQASCFLVHLILMSTKLKCFAGIFVLDGAVRRVTFEAADDSEARRLGVQWNVGVQGEVQTALDQVSPAAPPLAYDERTARFMIGGTRPDGEPGVSRTFLYKELVAGRLTRLPGTRRLLITHASIEQRRALRN